MSVINKMLRDLDQRQTGLAGGLGASMPSERVALGTLPITALQLPRQRAGLPRAMWLVVLLVAMGGVAGWYWQASQRSESPPVLLAGTQLPVPTTQLPSSAAGRGNRLAPVVAGVKVVAHSSEAKFVTPAVPLPKLVPRMAASVQPQVFDASSGAATGTLRMESSLQRLPASPSMSQKLPTQTAAARPAPLDALAQAQSLWNAGSHTAATELLGQALGRMESTLPTGMSEASQSPIVALARELARMQMADGQVGQALALLRHLEPQLAQVADVWAMRGNAAQRLGQHAEAAQSYHKALALRPDEPRWMLGAAVSLAAQGQIAAAGELAEYARSMGALRPEVANYLRQLGVVIRTE